MQTITQTQFDNLKGSDKIKALNDRYADRLKVIPDDDASAEDLFGCLSNIVRPGSL